MKKTTLLKVVNFCIAVLFVVVGGTAVAGSIFQMPVYVVHQYAGYAFILFALLHIMLNWAWIKSIFFKGLKSVPYVTNSQKKSSLR
jgi:hypothetical protein